MRILLTGVNGFVGQQLFKRLSEQHEVYGIYHSGIALFPKCFRVDLTSDKDVSSFYQDNNKIEIDTIIHVASRMAAANNLDDISVLTDNGAMAKGVAILAKNFNVKRVINFSSSSVYPNIDGVFNEESRVDPSANADCIYGLSKFNSEIILNFLLKNSSIAVTHLRISVIYGDGMNNTRLIPMLEKELSETNKITLYGNGERLQNMIHIEKLIDYLLSILSYPVVGILNVSDETLTVCEIAKRIIEKKGNTHSEIKLVPEGNRSQFRLNTTRLQKCLSAQNPQFIK